MKFEKESGAWEPPSPDRASPAPPAPCIPLTHGGAIEGFTGYLTYVPDRRIAVIVLGNVIGAAPDPMSRQLVDAILDRPVTLASERKAVPISKEDLARFAGVYDLGPTLSLTIAGRPLRTHLPVDFR